MTEMVYGSMPRRVSEPVLPKWWRTLDKWSLGAVLVLFGIGILLSISRYGLDAGAHASSLSEVGRYSYERIDLGRGDGRSRVSGAGGRALSRPAARADTSMRTASRTAARAGSYRAEVPRAGVGDGRIRSGGSIRPGGG